MHVKKHKNADGSPIPWTDAFWATFHDVDPSLPATLSMMMGNLSTGNIETVKGWMMALNALPAGEYFSLQLIVRG
jgi:hypothetical protein